MPRQLATGYLTAGMRDICSAGLPARNHMIEKIHIYLNFASIDACLSKEDYFLRLLVIFERRVGKRQIKEIWNIVMFRNSKRIK